MRTAVIGGGAAGCFSAIELKRRWPECSVDILEAGKKPLAKVALTGGGRCNLTNSFENISSLREVYPRGEQLMKRALKSFSQKDVCEWFVREGVELTVQDDGCVFPAAQDAMVIVNALLKACRRTGVRICCNSRVSEVSHIDGSFRICTSDGKELIYDCVIVTSGGSPRISGLDFLSPLKLDMVDPVPSLFTFRIAEKELCEMMGTVIKNAVISIPGAGYKVSGDLLITDWGLSGPAALKLSSHAARYLNGRNCHSPVAINWCRGMNDAQTRSMLTEIRESNGARELRNVHPQWLSGKVWKHLIYRSGIRNDIRWAELGTKGLNRLCNTLVNDCYTMNGRAAFKEEFVTCGGIALENINMSTMESRRYPGLYFAGEVLDVDAVTGGFNLQAAWSTGYVAARGVSGKKDYE